MKSIVEQLSGKERDALALFYGTDAFAAFKKICQLEINGLGKDALAANTMDQVNFFKGRASMAKELYKLIEATYKDEDKQKSWYV